MIYVTYGNDSEPLINLNSFEMEQEVNGDFSISFTSLKSERNIGYSILKEESIITVDGYDFRVKQMKENKAGKGIVALSTFFDLIDTRRDEIFGGVHTFNEFLTFIFSGTGWRTSTDFNESLLVPNFGENNLVALTQQLCEVFQCEFKIGRDKQIHFSKQIGGDNDAQYRYGHNVQALSKNVDTTRLKTFVKGYGATNEDGTQLYVSYRSPVADNPAIGVREADPIHDDRFTDSQSFLEHLKRSLIDYPEVTFELDSIELTDKELGEKVWLIYEPLDIEFFTRILSIKKGLVNGQIRTKSVVLGNKIPKNINDILIEQKVEIDEQKKITRSKFEQTNDRITLEVEEIGVTTGKLEVRADKVEARVETNEKDIASLEITAKEIKAEVKDNKDNISSLTIQAGKIESRVSGLDNRMGQAESSITQTNNRITIETRGDNLISSINVAPSGVSINADKINLNGAVMVNGSITGSSTLEIETNATVGQTLNIGRNWNSSYAINFGGYAGATSIQSDGDTIHLRAINGVNVPSGGLLVDGNYVLTTNGRRYSLEYDPRGMIWFKDGGRNLGFVRLEN